MRRWYTTGTAFRKYPNPSGIDRYRLLRGLSRNTTGEGPARFEGSGRPRRTVLEAQSPVYRQCSPNSDHYSCAHHLGNPPVRHPATEAVNKPRRPVLFIRCPPSPALPIRDEKHPSRIHQLHLSSFHPPQYHQRVPLLFAHLNCPSLAHFHGVLTKSEPLLTEFGFFHKL